MKYNGISIDEAMKRAKKERVARKYPDIEFVTKKGTKVRLEFKGREYRAHKITEFGKEPMGYGAVRSENLIKYITENL